MPDKFPITSRYHAVEIAELTSISGRTIVYLRRRFIAPPERFELLQEHTVADGERVDTVAATYLGGPEQFWRIADANAVLHPAELTAEAGHKVRITLPEGITGGASL